MEEEEEEVAPFPSARAYLLLLPENKGRIHVQFRSLLQVRSFASLQKMLNSKKVIGFGKPQEFYLSPWVSSVLTDCGAGFWAAAGPILLLLLLLFLGSWVSPWNVAPTLQSSPMPSPLLSCCPSCNPMCNLARSKETCNLFLEPIRVLLYRYVFKK